MSKIIEKIMPNVYIYKEEILQSTLATLQMFLISGIISFIIGLILGIIVVVIRPGGLKENKIIYRILDFIINILRAIPFIILLVLLVPFTRTLVGTSIGIKGAIVPLVFGTVPFFTRQVETALSSVDNGKIEAAVSMGSSDIGIIFRVYLKEAVPELIRVTTITAVSLVGLIAMAGAVGAGGLGDFAINYGQGQNHQDIVIICVILTLIIVSIIQGIGTFLAKKTKNHKLFSLSKKEKEENEKNI